MTVDTRELATGLVRLEGAARRFHEALARHEKFRATVPDVVKQNLQPVYAEARKRTLGLSDQEIAALSPGLGEEGRRWVQDLYESFRRLHVEAIGRQGQDGLYEAWRSVVEQMDKVQAALRAGRDTWWYWVGHTFAGILALTGLLFLADFWWSFADRRLHPAPAPAPVSAPASPDSQTAPAPRDTSRSVRADTSRSARADTSQVPRSSRP